MSLNIGIILGSTRKGRVSPQIGSWVQSYASKKNDGNNYEIIDIQSFNLPLLGESEDVKPIEKWQQTLSRFDGFIFVVAEYNHSITGALKNALDLAKEPWHNKVAGIVSYGSAGGARAAEHLRGILGELQIADVRSHVLLSLFHDFEQFKTFKPQSLHQTNMDALLKQVNAWGQALKTIR